MSKSKNPLALRPKTSDVPKARVVFRQTDHDPQYAVDPAALGEFAVQWTADWYIGRFSITDLPPEWVAFVQTSNHGSFHEATYEGDAEFSRVPWNSLPWDDRVTEWIFSQVLLTDMEMDGMLENILDAMRDADETLLGKSRRQLPFHGTLALPDEGTSML